MCFSMHGNFTAYFQQQLIKDIDLLNLKWLYVKYLVYHAALEMI